MTACHACMHRHCIKMGGFGPKLTAFLFSCKRIEAVCCSLSMVTAQEQKKYHRTVPVPNAAPLCARPKDSKFKEVSCMLLSSQPLLFSFQLSRWGVLG